MNAALRDMLDAFSNPPMRHAMMVHWPVVLSNLLVPLTFLAAILPRNKTCRWFAIVAGALLVIAAFITVNSGEGAQAAMTGPGTPAVNELVSLHEDMAEKVWMFALVITVLAAVSGHIKPALRVACSWLAVALSLALAGWVAFTAHLGGTLVYREGIGPHPAPESGLQPPPPHAASTSADPNVAFFEEQIAPILAEHCLKCHNPQQARRKGGLDLSTLEAALRGGKDGVVIIPGKPEESELILRVRNTDPAPDEADTMPPPPNAPLTEGQAKLLEQWIRDGAAWGRIGRGAPAEK